MRKEKSYSYVRFTPEVLSSAEVKLRELALASKSPVLPFILTVQHDDSKWTYSELAEFMVDYRKYTGHADFLLKAGELSVRAWVESDYTNITVEGSNRVQIESLFHIFESSQAGCRIPIPESNKRKPTIFIGHGRNGQWRDVKDHLQDKHGYSIEAYETGARAGHTIRDVLEEMVGKSNFAILVFTKEDEQSDGQFRARQNVIHEAGLFQGRLGFSRAIVLLEEGVEEFSNVQGVQYIPFKNIKETFGEILATLRREFHTEG